MIEFKTYIEWKCPVCGHINRRRRRFHDSTLLCKDCSFPIETTGHLILFYNKKRVRYLIEERRENENILT